MPAVPDNHPLAYVIVCDEACYISDSDVVSYCAIMYMCVFYAAHQWQSASFAGHAVEEAKPDGTGESDILNSLCIERILDKYTFP